MRYVSGMSAFMVALALSAASPACAIAQATVRIEYEPWLGKLDLLDAANVAALEVYARGATMPASLQAADNSCGVIAIWSGSRR